MVSIVLPTFNGEEYLRKSIERILCQSYNDFELIIVNDCSTDTTPLIINELAQTDERIKIINNTKNQKLPKSLNIGFSQAKGEYFTWTSDDNYYHKDALKKMVNYLRGNIDKDIVYALYNYIDENDNVIGYSEEIIDGNVDRLYEGNMVGACFLYKKEVHERLKGYDVEQFLVEDYDFWLRASRYFKYGFIKECLYDYRLHKNSLTTKYSSYIEEKKILLQKREFLEGNLSHDIQKKICIGLIKYYYKVDDLKNMRIYLLRLKKMSIDDYKTISIAYKLACILGINITKFLSQRKYGAGD